MCCSYDLRVCDHACDLIAQGVAERLVVSGRSGNWTRHLWSKAEAQGFHRWALANGIEPGATLLEERSTKIGENVAYSRALLPQAKRVTFVTKPNSVLRVALTVPVQWTDIAAFVDSPPLAFPDQVSYLHDRGVLRDQ
ncbi:MAG: YdcF family protein [Steroidobacteraceae bacterium]